MREEKSILVIDDVAIIRAYVKAALRELPLHVSEASSGPQALEMQADKPADLILCDLNMPGGGGEAFLRALRDKGDRTPVVMLTAEGGKEVVSRLIELGIQGYLLKPFKPAVLVSRVCELLGGLKPRFRELGPAEAPPDAAAGDAAAEQPSDPPGGTTD